MDNPVYKNIVVSEDGSFTTIIIDTNNYSHEDNETDMLEGLL